MKIKVTEEIAGKVVVTNTIIKLNVNPFDSEGSKIPLAIFEHKGDILVADAVASPDVVPVGSDGQVLVADSTEATGVRWKTMQLGTITLSNSESFAVPSGSVVTQGTVSGTFRIATSADTTNLYVTSENILPGEDGVLYATSGVSCIVRVTDAAVAIGDKLAVSAIDGVAETTTGAYFAIAVTGKNAGEIGTVNCILVNQNVSTLDVSGGGTGRPTLTANTVLVGNGVDPVKLIPTHAGVLQAAWDGAEPSFIAGQSPNFPIYIPEYADLNNYQIPGYYWCPLNVVVETLSHCPVYEAFGLEIIRTNGVSQRLTTHNRYNWQIYQRSNYANIWGEWSLVFRDLGIPSTTITLNAASWSNKQYTYTLNGVLAKSTVWADPADSSRDAYFASDVWLSSNSENQLVFKCAVQPTVNLSVKIVYTI